MTDMNEHNRQVVDEFRANAGRVAAMGTMPVLLLHTTGARSGEPRLHPLVYQALDGSYAIFASKAGAPTNPDWYHNLVANPSARIEVGAETLDVSARVAEGDERERIWAIQKERFANFAEYETMTTRTIPVVVLDPA